MSRDELYLINGALNKQSYNLLPITQISIPIMLLRHRI